MDTNGANKVYTEKVVILFTPQSRDEPCAGEALARKFS